MRLLCSFLVGVVAGGFAVYLVAQRGIWTSTFNPPAPLAPAVAEQPTKTLRQETEPAVSASLAEPPAAIPQGAAAPKQNDPVAIHRTGKETESRKAPAELQAVANAREQKTGKPNESADQEDREAEAQAENNRAEWQEIELTAGSAKVVGDRIWESECGHTVDGLTSWNRGEDFASLGIGHFIWYSKDKDAIFEESFPALMKFLRNETDVEVPEWLKSTADCPWNSLNEFEAEFESAQMKSLRNMLATTVTEQTKFLVRRFNTAFQKVLEYAGEDRQQLETSFRQLAGTPEGIFAMIDYTNFKGEGTNPNERYGGEGWGLLQVLQLMAPTGDDQAAVVEFSRAADAALTRRVANNPPDERWLAGWRNRVAGYQRKFPAEGDAKP